MKKDSKAKTLTHLKQALGMVKKVSDMVENDRYCIDVLQQSLAAIGFMKSANKVILENHLNCCFKEGMVKKNSKKQDKLIQELIRIMDKTKCL